MTATAVENRAGCDFVTGRGTKVTAHSGDPGVTGANLIATTPASGTTTWPAATDGSGSDAGYAVSTGSPVTLGIPPSTNVTHYGIWNGATFLRGKALDNPIVVGSGATNVDITPKERFKGGQ